MSGKDDPVLKSMEVYLTDNEQDILLNQGKCPNCQDKTLAEEGDMTETKDISPTVKYYIKCNSCLTDFTVYLTVKHVTHIATFKNGERIRPCLDEISRKAQSKQNEQDSKSEESNT